MSRPDEGLIHAWLDGECTPEESARIEALVASDPAWAAAVAEARGLVAASSRILGALDAVPARVLPKGSRAVPDERARGFRVRPWMGIAAGLVLVAGTVTALRERVGTDFIANAALEAVAVADAPAVSTQTGQAGEAAAGPPPTTGLELAASTDIPAIGPARVASGGAGVGRASVSGAIVGAATTSGSEAVAAAPLAVDRAVEASRAMEAGRAAETARAEELSRAREQESRRVMAPPPAAPALAARAPAGFAEAAKTLAPNALAGCWRVSAPPELTGLLREPSIVRMGGDTLVLQLARERQVTVVRTDDQLRGALTAIRETCPPDDDARR